MLTAWLIYCEEDADKNSGSIEMFRREFGKYNIFCRLVIFEKLNIVDNRLIYNDVEEEFPDIVVNRTRSFELACFFESRVKHLFNSSQVAFLGNDKVGATRFAEKLDIPVMAIYETAESIDSFPVVVKTKNGHGGSEVFLADDVETVHKLENNYENLFFQKYSPDGNSDMRVYVVGNQVMCAICRHSDKDFRSNFSLGGKVEEVTVPEEVMGYVSKMVAAMGEVAYCGIDFIRFGENWVFNEIEDMVGARSVYTYTGHDPIAGFVNYIWRSLHE